MLDAAAPGPPGWRLCGAQPPCTYAAWWVAGRGADRPAVSGGRRPEARAVLSMFQGFADVEPLVVFDPGGA